MSEQEELNKWDFERELLKIPAKCRKLTNKTAKEKVREVLEKYDDLICFTKESRDFHINESNKYKNICEAFRSGVVRYKGGFFMVNEISTVTVSELSVIVSFKNGKEKSFTNDFKWLENLY